MSPRIICALLFSALMAACSQPPQRLNYGNLQSAAMGKPMRYATYAPRDLKPTERLPVVLFLHGSGDGPESLDAASIGTLLDQPGAPRVVLVAPQGDRGFWENWHNGKRQYRDWVIREIFPKVQRDFHTLPCPEGCHIIGISMGGYGALMSAIYEPGMFASITALSAPVYTAQGVKDFYDSWLWPLLVPITDIWGPYDPASIAKRDLYQRWHSASDLHGSKLFLAWGDAEDADMIRDNERLHQMLIKRGIPHQSRVFHGGHEWSAWTPVILSALKQQVTRQSQ